MQFVYTKDARAGAPLQVRERVSGDHNAIKHNVTKLTLPEIASRLWVEVHQSDKAKDHLMVALRSVVHMTSKTTPLCIFASPPPTLVLIVAIGIYVFMSLTGPHCPIPLLLQSCQDAAWQKWRSMVLLAHVSHGLIADAIDSFKSTSKECVPWSAVHTGATRIGNSSLHGIPLQRILCCLVPLLKLSHGLRFNL